MDKYSSGGVSLFSLLVEMMLSAILCSGCGLLTPSMQLCRVVGSVKKVVYSESPLREKRGWRDGGGRERGSFISFFFSLLSLTCSRTAASADFYNIWSSDINWINPPGFYTFFRVDLFVLHSRFHLCLPSYSPRWLGFTSLSWFYCDFLFACRSSRIWF